MNILFLGSPDNPLIPFLKRDFQVFDTVNPVTPDIIDNLHVGFVVSYGYKHILKSDFLSKLPFGRMINLHISYLPFNRGADPNFWSYMEYTPCGVSCHVIDEGIDTGSVLFRERVTRIETATLRETYHLLQWSMEYHFKQKWPLIKEGEITPVPQSELEGYPGTFHKSKDKLKYISEIQDKYLDMPIYQLEDYIGDIQLSAQNRDGVLSELRETHINHEIKTKTFTER